jgi:ubiquinone/menaquinone biosynthesis C-methylase UbiE
MSSKFNARDADAYERLMGRWSRVLAQPFLEFSGLASGERILDVGCGTGSLTFTIPQVVDVAHVQGIDFSSVYVEAARQRITNPRITISQGDVCGLSFQDATFDRSLALLVVLHFVPESQRAVSEMSRVVSPEASSQRRFGTVMVECLGSARSGTQPWLSFLPQRLPEPRISSSLCRAQARCSRCLSKPVFAMSPRPRS